MASLPPACAPWHDRGVPRGRQSAEPLWRAIAVFRFAGLGYAVLLTAVIDRAEYARLGWPHSIEVWRRDTLVGGAIRIGIGDVISGDSLFGRHQDAARPRPALRLFGPG